MILADKIVELRKRNDWSQEELAGKLGVSRQAISKWEGAQSTPDLDRIVAMSKLFGVSTDYLVKDEIEAETPEVTEEAVGSGLRKLSLEEANAFLNAKLTSAKPIALGVWLCVMAFIPWVTSPLWGTLSLGLAFAYIIDALLIGVAVALFLLNAYKVKSFEWMQKEVFETAYGVDGMVKDRLSAFMPRFILHIALGVFLCIVACAIFTATAFLPRTIHVQSEVVISVGIAIAAFAVYLFVTAGIVRGAYSILLQEGDYRQIYKTGGRKLGSVMDIYWMLVIAIYLAYSFLTNDWRRSWIIWPIAGVLCPVLSTVLEMLYGRNRKG